MYKLSPCYVTCYFFLACPLDYAKCFMWWYLHPDWSHTVPLHVTYHQCMVASGPVLNICTSPKKMPFYRWKLSHAFGYLVSHVHLFKLILTCTPLVFYLGLKQRMATHERTMFSKRGGSCKGTRKFRSVVAILASNYTNLLVVSSFPPPSPCAPPFWGCRWVALTVYSLGWCTNYPLISVTCYLSWLVRLILPSLSCDGMFHLIGLVRYHYTSHIINAWLLVVQCWTFAPVQKRCRSIAESYLMRLGTLYPMFTFSS